MSLPDRCDRRLQRFREASSIDGREARVERFLQVAYPHRRTSKSGRLANGDLNSGCSEN
jgi:hypothetical protein